MRDKKSLNNWARGLIRTPAHQGLTTYCIRRSCHTECQVHSEDVRKERQVTVQEQEQAVEAFSIPNTFDFLWQRDYMIIDDNSYNSNRFNHLLKLGSSVEWRTETGDSVTLVDVAWLH